MNAARNRIWNVFAIVLFAVIVTGCTYEKIKTLPPLDPKTAEEECAVLIIPANGEVKRIDGAKRGLFSSWGTGWSMKSKAATLLVPAGEHTIICEYYNPQAGWSAKDLKYTAAMSAGKMYIVLVTQDEKTERSIIFSVIDIAGSFIRDNIVDDILFFLDLLPLPRPNPKGIVYQISEIAGQTELDQYLLKEPVVKKMHTGVFLITSYIICTPLFGFIGIMLLNLSMKELIKSVNIMVGLDSIVGSIVTIYYTNSFKIPSRVYILGVLIGFLWCFIIKKGFSKLGYFLFMGKLMNSNIFIIRFIRAILVIGLIPTGIIIINYNSGGFISLYLMASLLIGFGLSGFDIAHSLQLNDKGVMDLEFNNYTEAVFYFNLAIKKNPLSAVCFANRALAYLGLQDWEKAIADYTEAVRLAPNDIQFKKALADAKAQAANGTPKPLEIAKRIGVDVYSICLP